MYSKTGNVPDLIATIRNDLQSWQDIDQKHAEFSNQVRLGEMVTKCGCLLPLGVGFLWGFNIWRSVEWTLVWVIVGLLLALGVGLQLLASTKASNFPKHDYQAPMMERILDFLQSLEPQVATMELETEVGFGTTEEERVKIVKLTEKYGYPREETYLLKLFNSSADLKCGGVLKLEATRKSQCTVESVGTRIGSRDSSTGFHRESGIFETTSRVNEDTYLVKLSLPTTADKPQAKKLLEGYKVLVEPKLEITEGQEIQATVTVESQELVLDLKPFSELLDWALVHSAR